METRTVESQRNLRPTTETTTRSCSFAELRFCVFFSETTDRNTTCGGDGNKFFCFLFSSKVETDGDGSDGDDDTSFDSNNGSNVDSEFGGFGWTTTHDDSYDGSNSSDGR